jgi:hypothetical protein
MTSRDHLLIAVAIQKMLTYFSIKKDMDITSQEWATLFWIAVLLLLSFKFLVPLVKLVFKPENFLKIYFPNILFCGLMFTTLSCVGLWDYDKLKISIVWFCSIGLIFPIRMVINSKDEHRNIMISDLILQNFTIAAFLELLLTSYSFGFVFSIFYIGSFVILSLAKVIAEQNKNLDFVKVVNFVLFLYVAIAFGSLAHGLYTNPQEFFKAQTVVDYLYPVLLSLIYTPFAWLYSSIIICEDKLVKLWRYIPDTSLRRYAKRKAMFEFSLDDQALVRWTREIKRVRVLSKQEVIASIAKVSSMIAREKRPPKIDRSSGWSPYQAKDFLVDQGLKSGEYQEGYGQWNANAVLNLGERYVKSNKIYFSVEGDEYIVNCLVLRISIDLLTQKKTDLNRFMHLCAMLTNKALDIRLPDRILSQITKPIGFEIVHEDKKLTFSKTFNNFGESRSIDATFRILHLT